MFNFYFWMVTVLGWLDAQMAWDRIDRHVNNPARNYSFLCSQRWVIFTSSSAFLKLVLSHETINLNALYETVCHDSQLQWTTLAQAKAVMMYRIVNNLGDVPHTFLAPCTVSLRGHSYKYMIPFTRTGVYQQSFFPNSIRIWNNLPEDLINCTTLASFKQGVQSVQLR